MRFLVLIFFEGVICGKVNLGVETELPAYRFPICLGLLPLSSQKSSVYGIIILLLIIFYFLLYSIFLVYKRGTSSRGIKLSKKTIKHS